MRKLTFTCALFVFIFVLCSLSVVVNAGEPFEPPSRYPSVRSVLAVLCAGEGLLDSGKYSPDQQKLLFNRNYKDKTYLVSGKISNVGTSFTNRKYISVMVTTGHYFDVYPSSDFDLLDYTKGNQVSFVGKWTLFGSGIMFHHEIEEAEQFSSHQDAIRAESVKPVHRAEGPYLCDLLKKKPYRAAWNALFKAEKGVDHWVIGYGKNCDGPSSPSETLEIEGGIYCLAAFCKTHDCGGNVLYVIFAPEASRAWALLATEKMRWFGNPSPAIRAALKAASEK